MLHDIFLALMITDQTPTPTRFLRSCEESGLFQELEEANPFDQDFAKSASNDDANKSQSKNSTSEQG